MAAHGHLTVAAILVAAGSGSRLGAGVPKAFVDVAGRTLLEHASSRFVNHPRVRDVVVAAPAAMLATATRLVPRARVVNGGATRQDSVARALRTVADDIDIVLVHDVARAFVPTDVITRVIDGLSLQGADATVPVLALTDTIRRFDVHTGVLGDVVDRSQLLAMQTPQGFWRPVLVAAHAARSDSNATDDATLVEALGGRVMAVRGDERAFKVTVPLDLLLAEVVAGD